MKIIHSLLLLAALGLLLNTVSAPKESFFSESELNEVYRRLNSVGNF
ncbi:MAG: hypothetical protein AB1509_08625 [Chloroflexota bacterium]